MKRERRSRDGKRTERERGQRGGGKGRRGGGGGGAQRREKGRERGHTVGKRERKEEVRGREN